jgi:hypothetical protein
MGILDSQTIKRYAKITQCNNGYVVMCHLPSRKMRAEFGGSNILLLSERSGWVPFSNKVLDENTKKTLDDAKYLLRFGFDPFELGGAL